MNPMVIGIVAPMAGILAFHVIQTLKYIRN